MDYSDFEIDPTSSAEARQLADSLRYGFTGALAIPPKAQPNYGLHRRQS
jgi:hypothetical protein